MKIADALGVEVYQLFVPQNATPITIEKNDENERIRSAIQKKVIEDVRLTLNKVLDRMER